MAKNNVDDILKEAFRYHDMGNKAAEKTGRMSLYEAIKLYESAELRYNDAGIPWKAEEMSNKIRELRTALYPRRKR